MPWGSISGSSVKYCLHKKQGNMAVGAPPNKHGHTFSQ